MIESVLRPYGLGSTQYYVLHQLAENGATMQRELAQALHLEKATLSVVVTSLVSRGLVDRTPDPVDQRQRSLRLTPAGKALWDELPDPRAVVQQITEGASHDADLATAIRVLQALTQRLDEHVSGGARQR
jgi:DNA-binding MarR family transcriptional regulator